MSRGTAVLAAAGKWRETHRLRVGWGGNDGLPVTGVTQDLQGGFMARGSWTDLSAGHWLDSPAAALQPYVAANPGRIAVIGVPLIPHDSVAASGWNTLLDSAIAGTHDADYVSMGENLALNSPKTCYCRLWWEFNMDDANVNSTKFKNAFARAVPLIRQGFANQATAGQTIKIVLCSMPDRSTKEAMYPGSAYVDVVSYDVYGKVYASTTPSQATALAEINGYLSDLVAWGQSTGKPVALDEWGNWQTQPNGTLMNRGYGDWPDFITAVFDWATTRSNNVAYLNYFNEAGGDVGITLDDQPNSKAVFISRTKAVQ